MFLLDTDHISIIQRETSPEFQRLSTRMQTYPAAVFHYSSVSFHEETVGAHTYINRARKTEKVVKGYQRLEKILAHFAAVQVLPFDDAAGSVFDSLKAQRVHIGTMDLRIAAIALARNLTVLSRNARDFRKVPGLNVEDWTH